MSFHLGTSGWSYPGWKGRFYPPDLPAKDWLSFYAEHFSTVEINMTFYRFPKPETLESWLERTPPEFTFTLKANRQITHRKRLQNVRSEVRYFYILANSLGKRLGCILFQLPPSIRLDLALLQDFLDTLEPEFRNVIEFRHESWYNDRVYEILQAAGVTFCTVSSAQVPGTAVATSPVAYFRFHGLTGGYKYNYSDEELKGWAQTIRGAKAEESYMYFNNDYQAYAVRNCLKLGELLAGPSPDPR
ncbi:MAG: DUF72 domain-containing protein [Candidatus Aminicenantes bacterium]|nr:DUF72 domain-containing protein [Candidatus Aminicenantes bacterium]